MISTFVGSESGAVPESDCAFRSRIRKLSSDSSSDLSQFLVCLLDVSVWVQLGNVVQRHEMKVDVRHAEAFDGNADPFGVGGLSDRF